MNTSALFMDMNISINSVESWGRA